MAGTPWMTADAVKIMGLQRHGAITRTHPGPCETTNPFPILGFLLVSEIPEPGVPASGPPPPQDHRGPAREPQADPELPGASTQAC